MNSIYAITISCGSSRLDELVQGLLPGDNVVLQIDRVENYAHFAQLFAGQAIS